MTQQTDLLPEFNENQHEDLAFGYKVLAFLFPIVGAIMYFNHQKTNPIKSKSACYSALFGIGFGILINILTASIS